MAVLRAQAIALARAAAAADELHLSVDWQDEFAATVNDAEAVEQLRQAAIACGGDLHEFFPWSEDCGEYTRRYLGTFFGLGAGEQQPPLHRADYDFPDALLEPRRAAFC